MFDQLKTAVQQNFAEMAKLPTLFYVAIDRDQIWEQYLNGFADPIVRQEYNCNCCKSFLRQWGGIVAIVDNQVQTLWDGINLPEFEQATTNLRSYVAALPVTDVFLNSTYDCGTDQNYDLKDQVTWTHLYIKLLGKHVAPAISIDSFRGEKRDNKAVLKRSLDELTITATETILELIAQNSLYRGKESEGILTLLLKLQTEYAKVPADQHDNYCWLQSTIQPQALTRIRNSAIGTLLINLSEGMELDTAVGKFEQVVAPTNYKRPTALVTPKMVEQARATLAELGLLNAMERRYATEADVEVTNVLFTDNSTPLTDVFEQVSKAVVVNPRKLSKIEEVSINEFIAGIVPRAKAISVLLEGKHLPNMVSLLTAVDPSAPTMFKWDNPFSWSYTGGITDSLKERVVKAGGRVDGVFRFTHSWNEIEPNQSLMDLHVFMPGNEHSYKSNVHDYYGTGRRVGWNQRNDAKSGGVQDVDYTSAAPTGYIPVENITFPSIARMPEGKYICKIHNWAFRSTGGRGKAEIEVGGNLYQYEYPRTKNKEWVPIAEVTLKDGQFEIKHLLPENSSPTSKWGVTTYQWIKVKKFTLSPNYWNGNTAGSKHFMFFLDGCLSDEAPRPFFNEFLNPALDKHRKVLEILGAKVRVEDSPYQLSGVGFSETQPNHLYARVDGSFSRVIKIVF